MMKVPSYSRCLLLAFLAFLCFGNLAFGGGTNSTSFVLGWTNVTAGPGGGWVSVALAVSGGSAWPASAGSDWLTVAGGAGSTNVLIGVGANAGGVRTGTVTVAGQVVTVTQAGSNYVAATPAATVATATANDLTGVAADGAGNVYFTAGANNAVNEWVAQSNTVVPLVAAGLNAPQGVAVDAAGNVYIADTGNQAVKEWVAQSNLVVTLVSGLNDPQGVAVDAAGNVYIADTGNNAVKEWVAQSNTVVTLVNGGLNGPYGVAVDVAGNVYIADTFNGQIQTWSPRSRTLTPLAIGGLAAPTGVAVDGGGNVYVADYFGGVSEWVAASNSVTALGPAGAWSSPYGVAAAPAGGVYVGDAGVISAVPSAWVAVSPVTEGAAAGTDTLPPVVPASQPLSGPFAPVSDAGWLTVNGSPNGAVAFAFTAETVPVRSAHLSVLGVGVPVTQGTPTTISLAPLSPVTYGTPVTWTATVSPAPTGGTVQFYTNGVAVGLPVSPTNGTANFTPDPLAAGTYPVSAAFGGTPGYGPANAATNLQVVSPAAAVIVTLPVADNLTYGQALAQAALTGGVGSVPGAFGFATPGLIPGAGTNAEPVVFTPADAVDYLAATGTVSVVVINPPVITQQPSNLLVLAGQTASFQVSATGTAPSYQWYFRGVGITGANESTLLLSNADATNAGSYFVTVSNAVGEVTSSTASLEVRTTPAATLTISNTPGGVAISLVGVSGYVYVIQITTNLADSIWTPVWTNRAPFTFTDTNGTQVENQFFRGVYQR